MSNLYNIPSGSITAGKQYQIYGTTGDVVTYDGTDYYPGDFFVGVDGVTDYTVSGAPIVTDVSRYTGGNVEYYDPYTGLLNDESTFKQQDISVIDKFFIGMFNDDSQVLGVLVSWEEESNYKNKVSFIRTFPNNMTEKQRITEQNL